MFFYLAAGIIILATAMWTAGVPILYDTDLYHAQTVRWIEEYGVVKGLGNLHHRFPYNSSFLTLQALFSLKWLLGHSLHTMNGFLCCVFMMWALATNRLFAAGGLKERPDLCLSDLLKLAAIVYICDNRTTISSLSTDILPMVVVLYVFAKWAELYEKTEKDALPYAFLSVVCVWGATVKLSSAFAVLLALYPLFLLLKGARWKQLAGCLLAGAGAALPWLIRNVIISGYLLYPYPAIDIFPVDWKMPVSEVDHDRKEIIVWARGTRDVSLIDQPLREWVRVWYQEMNLYHRTLVIAGLICTVGVLAICLLNLYKRAYWKYTLLYVVGVICLLAWFFSAPAIRFGKAYVMIPVCIIISKLRLRPFVGMAAMYGVLAVLVCKVSFYISTVEDAENVSVVRQEDYRTYETVTADFNGITVYLPVEGDRTGYEPFPATPYMSALDKMELRGESLEEGFRVKDSR